MRGDIFREGDNERLFECRGLCAKYKEDRWLPINDLDDTLVKCLTECEEGLINDASEILEEGHRGETGSKNTRDG